MAWASVVWSVFEVVFGALAPPLVVLDFAGDTTGVSEPWVLAVPSDARLPVIARHGFGLTVPNVEVSAVCGGSTARGVRCVASDKSSFGLLALGPGQRIRGRVTGDRNFILGSSVALVPASLRLRRELLLPVGFSAGQPVWWTPTTDSGEFIIGQVSSGSYRILVRTRSGERFRVQEEIVLTGTPAVLDVGEIAATPGAAVDVSVTDEELQPVANARVRAIQRPKLDEASRVFEGLTDARGAITLSGLDSAIPVKYQVSATGFSDLILQSPGAVPTLDIELKRPESVFVRVTDQAGSPVSGALMKANTGPSIVTDQNGEGTLPGLSAGAVTLSVTRIGYVPGEEQVVIPAVRQIEIILTAAQTVAAKVVGRRTGLVVPGAQIESTPAVVSTTTDGAGEFSLPSFAGVVELTIGAEGFLSQHFLVQHGQPTHFELSEQADGGWLAVFVESETRGQGCRACEIGIRSTQSGETTLFLKTAADGVATSPALPPGKYIVSTEDLQNNGESIFVSAGPAQSAEVYPGATTHVSFPSSLEQVSLATSRPLPNGSSILVKGSSSRQLVFLQDSRATIRRRRGEALNLHFRSDQRTEVFLGTIPPDTDQFTVAVGSSRVVGIGGPTPSEVALIGSGRVAARTVLSGARPFEFPLLQPGVYQVAIDGVTRQTLHVSAGQTLDLGKVSEK